MATQRVGSETSGPSPKGQLVEAVANGLVQFASPLYICGQSIMLTTCSPGARIEVRQNSQLLGHGTAVGDLAIVRLDPGKRILGGRPLKVSQIVCGSTASKVTTSPLPLAPPRTLSPPAIDEPLEECQNTISVHDTVPGAVVRIMRNGHTIYNDAMPLNHGGVLSGPLQAGEEISAEQSMPDCKLDTSAQNTVTVTPLTALKRPRIDGPLCAGPRQVTVSRLKPGATVRLYSDTTEIGRWEAPGGSLPVDIDVPLPAAIRARQELCGIVSDMSRPYFAAAARRGRWFVVEDGNGDDLPARAFAIHAALAHTGKIVIFSGNQHSREQHQARPQDLDHCQLFDCATLELEKIDAPTTDVFCSGHAFLPDGRLLVAGGTEKWLQPPDPTAPHPDHFPGLPDAWIFNPAPTSGAKYWSKTHSMHRGRWYPTLSTIRDGRVLALSGHPSFSDSWHNNNDLELYLEPDWQFAGASPSIISLTSGYLYPRIFAAPGGDVFSATPMLSGKSGRWTPGGGAAWQDVADVPPGGWGLYDWYNSCAVVLPMLEEEEFRMRVVLAGDTAAFIIDLGTPRTPFDDPQWRELMPRAPHLNGRQRINLNAVILPSCEVILVGGVEKSDDDDTAVHDPELLSRASGTWAWSTRRLAPSTIVRNYHSTALLMPDGRVWTAGSNRNALPGPEAVRRLEMEIYEPWYVCAERPLITAAPDTVHAGERFTVRVKSKEEVTRLALVRCGSSTHSFNPDQRFLGLKPVHEGDALTAVAPSSDILIPGYYLLFACTKRNVPSEGVFVGVSPLR
ncbi:galactose oxidase-like domain-containing protein [Actinomadura scrupuli]|uniref:galactose oxidase-like domain-containing protein n=1 Tax=Actinomadura scrupuli TaxID=559629 RepID=UPI003D95775C